MACILNMGVIFRPSLESYWFVCPVVYTLSPRTKLILKFFHMADNSDFLGPGQPGCEPCVKCSLFVGTAYRLFEPYRCPSALDVYWWNLASSDFYVYGKLICVLEISDFHLMASSKMRSRSGLESSTSPFTIRAWKISLCSVLSAWKSTITIRRNKGLVTKL